MGARGSVHCIWVLSSNEKVKMTLEYPHRHEFGPDPIREHSHVSSLTGINGVTKLVDDS